MLEQVKKTNVKKYRLWLILPAFLILAAWLVWLWYGKRSTAPATYQAAPPAAAVAGMPKVDHPTPSKIKVLPKQQASRKLGLPVDVANDDNQQIIDTTDIPPAPDGATTVTVMDITNGASKTLVKANPSPLFAFLRTGAAGVRYGINNNVQQQATLFIRQDVLRAGNIHLAATAEAYTVPTKGTSGALAAIEVSYRW